MPDFLPRREAMLLIWLRHFDQLINDDPAAFRIPPETAAEHRVLLEAFTVAYWRTVDPGTATRPAVAAKKSAKSALLKLTRSIAGMARAVTNDRQRVDLGLRPRKKPVRHVPPPDRAPLVSLLPLDGRKRFIHPGSGSQAISASRLTAGTAGTAVTVLLRDPESSGMALPKNAHLATVFTYLGEEAPAALAQWQLQGLASVSAFNVNAGPAAPGGAKLWVMVRWTNRRGEPGPLSTPVYMRIAGGWSAAAA